VLEGLHELLANNDDSSVLFRTRILAEKLLRTFTFESIASQLFVGSALTRASGAKVSALCA
jgi:hypothetical protein